MKRRFLCFVLFLSLLTNSYAAGVPGAALGGEVASVMLYKAGIRGFAANDPRFGAALAAVGTAALEVGGAVVVAGTAPVWGTVLASAAIAGVVGYGLSALSNWLFNSNGTVTQSGSQSTTPIPAVGQLVWCEYNNLGRCGSSYGSSVIGSSSGDALKALSDLHFAQYKVSVPTATGYAPDYSYGYADSGAYPGGYFQCTLSAGTVIHGCISASVMQGQLTNAVSCVGVWVNGACQPVGTPPSTLPVGQVLSGLTSAQAATPLAPGDVAAIADGLWKQAAAQPGYSGLPYVSSDPITAADVSAARAANPSGAVSTVGDLASPIAVTSPVALPSTSPAAPSVGTGVNPSTTPQVNLGIDPGIGAPTLETTPTAQAILSPVFNLLPSFRNFVVPSHSGACPKPSITIFSKYMVMDAHCAVIENIRPTLHAVMFFVWLLLAALIVLAA